MTTTELTDVQAVIAKLRSNAQGGACSPPHASRANEGPQVNIQNWWPDLPAVPKNQPWDASRSLSARTQDKRLAWPIENPGDVFDWGRRSTDGFNAWIRTSTIPAELHKPIGVTGQTGEMMHVTFVLAPLGGQSGGGDRNLVALVYDCTKCSYTYTVDSGD